VEWASTADGDRDERLKAGREDASGKPSRASAAAAAIAANVILSASN